MSPGLMRRLLSAVVIGMAFASAASGCASAIETQVPASTPTVRMPRAGLLTPYLSPTATLTPAPSVATTPTSSPSPTPTPRLHTVKQGEDMFGIALRYHVTLEQLKTANPTVNPKFLKIGSVLVVPPSSQPEPTDTPQPGGTSTPIPLQLGAPRCLPSGEGGAWCFLAVHNDRDFAIEDVSAEFQPLSDDIAPLTAFLPLDLLPPGATLPLSAYFNPPLPADFQVTARVVSVLAQPANDSRYVPLQLQNQQVFIAESGNLATVTLDVAAASADQGAALVRVAAVAYDANGDIVGMRRWENDSASPLSAGKALPVSFEIYAVAGKIARVELFAEARP